MSEALKGRCALRYLDIRSTAIDGRSLAFAIKMNASLTYLDVRDSPRWDDAVFHVVGSALLEKGCHSNLSFARCDAFDLLPGTTTLSLQERALGIGVVHILAALLSRNLELRDLDLSATDIDQRGATAIASALQRNTSLTRLALQYNHMDDESKLSIQAAAGATLNIII